MDITCVILFVLKKVTLKLSLFFLKLSDWRQQTHMQQSTVVSSDNITPISYLHGLSASETDSGKINSVFEDNRSYCTHLSLKSTAEKLCDVPKHFWYTSSSYTDYYVTLTAHYKDNHCRYNEGCIIF